MKRYIVGILFAIFGLVGYAWDFEVNISKDPYNSLYMKFDWVEEGKTCQTATGIDENNGVNSFNWRTPGEIPSYIEYNGNQIEVIGIGDYSFAGAQKLCTENLILPSTLQYIGKGAFANNSQGQMQVTLELKNLQYIGDYAFYNATWFKGGFTFENIDYIGSYAFSKCNLTDITIRNTKEIGDHAFFGVTSITSVILENVEIIGDYAFTGLEGEGEHSASCGRGSATTLLSYLDLGQSVTWIGNYAFAECHKLQEIIIPNSVIHIGDYGFYHCEEACPIIFGQNVEYIGDWAFSGRSVENCGEPTIKLPSSLTYIGSHAFTFNNERGFSDLYVDAMTPPEMIPDEDGCTGFGYYDPDRINETFFNDPAGWIYSWVCLHVPEESYEYYKDHPYWGQFNCIVPEQPVDKEKPLSEIIDYIFIVPGETYSIIDYIEKYGIEKWNISDESIIKLTDNIITGQKIGQSILIGLNKIDLDDSYRWDGIDKEITYRPEIAIVVFVCPTITVIYDDIAPQEQQTKNYMNTPLAIENTSDLDELTEVDLSYQHIVVPNSYPKAKIDSAQDVTITYITKGHFDEDYMWTNEYTDLVKIEEKDNQFVGETSNDGSEYLVPINPLNENRAIKIYTLVEPYQAISGIEDDLISHITIKSFDKTIIIDGADAESIVKVYMVDGQLYRQTKSKTITFEQSGIYIILVNDMTFKVVVK